MIHIRPAGTVDARPLAELLNAIIAKGGTTAMTDAISTAQMRDKISLYSGQSAWTQAETDTGEVLGFQYIAPHPNLPSEAADIATFVKLGQTGLGIGSKLFEATRTAARHLGYAWINATIRADNDSGLTYYQSRGFETYKRLTNTTLADGTRVDRICTRYDLTR